jgi:hypothetical protein
MWRGQRAAEVPRLLGGLMLAASIIPIGDAIIVVRRNGTKLAGHGSGLASLASHAR